MFWQCDAAEEKVEESGRYDEVTDDAVERRERELRARFPWRERSCCKRDGSPVLLLRSLCF